jgi:hypothetical protein
MTWTLFYPGFTDEESIKSTGIAIQIQSDTSSEDTTTQSCLSFQKQSYPVSRTTTTAKKNK